MKAGTNSLPQRWVFYGFVVLCLWITGIILAPLLSTDSGVISKFIYFLYKPVCHQLPDRSFMIDGMPLAVCIRCISFYTGGLFVFLFYMINKRISLWPVSVYGALISPALMDFFLVKMGIYGDIEFIRVLTGISLGIALFQILIFSLSDFTSLRFSLNIDNG